MVEKSQLREQFRKQRVQFAKRLEGTGQMDQVSKQLGQNIQVLIQKKGSDDLLNATWGTYCAVKSEASSHCAEELLQDISWAYPKIEGENLQFFIPQNRASLKMGPWGIPEPDPESSTFVDVDDLQGVLVPGLAFDRHGGRCGQGKGYYDRALESYQGLKIGVGYSVQIAREPLPMDGTDVAMDCLATENEMLEIK